MTSVAPLEDGRQQFAQLDADRQTSLPDAAGGSLPARLAEGSAGNASVKN
jgi:hypothetical protein